ncbi:MAG: ATP-binding cassette domain-containing protein [Candidatus Kapaibacteriales bacterium]
MDKSLLPPMPNNESNSIMIRARNISKSFDGVNYIFNNINFETYPGEIIGILGPNGSGKTTLLKIVAGLTQPSSGIVELFENNKKIREDGRTLLQGFVAPYLNLFEEFTPIELISIISKIRGEKFNSENVGYLLDFFGIRNSMNKIIKGFSSGMKQRMKYIIALHHSPKFLFLDEPFTNLDSEGIDKVIETIARFKNENNIIFIATNDTRERELCTRTIDLKNFDSSL